MDRNRSSCTYQPTFPLNQIIDTIWVAKADAFDVSASHHAALFTELIFNYGDQFQVEGENTESFVSLSDHYIISGLKTSPFHTITSGKYLNVGFILNLIIMECYWTGLQAQVCNSFLIFSLKTR